MTEASNVTVHYGASGPAPVRYCHGCGAYDDHPRVVYVPDLRATAAGDSLYHYDCLPDHIELDAALAPIVAARAEGKRGEELREFAGAYARSIPAAPADTTEASA